NSCPPKIEPGETTQAYELRVRQFLTNVLDQFAPFYTRKIKNLVKRKGLVKLPAQLTAKVKEKHKLIKLSYQKPSEENTLKLKQVRGELRNLTRRFIHNHYHERLNKAGRNSKQIWNVIKDFLPRSKNQLSSLPIDPTILNNFYSSVGEKIVSN